MNMVKEICGQLIPEGIRYEAKAFKDGLWVKTDKGVAMTPWKYLHQHSYQFPDPLKGYWEEGDKPYWWVEPVPRNCTCGSGYPWVDCPGIDGTTSYCG